MTSELTYYDCEGKCPRFYVVNVSCVDANCGYKHLFEYDPVGSTRCGVCRFVSCRVVDNTAR